MSAQSNASSNAPTVERPILKAQKRVAGAFDDLFAAVKRLEPSFAPVLNPEGTIKEKETEKPPSANEIDCIFDKIVEGIQANAIEIHRICDRSAV